MRQSWHGGIISWDFAGIWRFGSQRAVWFCGLSLEPGVARFDDTFSLLEGRCLPEVAFPYEEDGRNASWAATWAVILGRPRAFIIDVALRRGCCCGGYAEQFQSS